MIRIRTRLALGINNHDVYGQLHHPDGCVLGPDMLSRSPGRFLHLLREGNSIRAIARITGASKTTRTKLLVDQAKAPLGIKITYSATSNASGFKLTKFGASSAGSKRTRTRRQGPAT